MPEFKMARGSKRAPARALAALSLALLGSLLFAAPAASAAAPPVWPPSARGWTGFIKPAWFGANTSGLDSDATLALVARHAVAGYAWEQGHGPGRQRVGREEALLAAAATRARDFLDRANASTVLFVYRQVQVCCRMFGWCNYANVAPEAAGFWLADPVSGDRCLAEQPWRTADALWDFRQPNATEWWLDNIVAELTSESALTSAASGAAGAVFLDEVDQGTCGYRGSTCNFSAFDAPSLAAQQAASNDMLARTAAALNAANIVPIFSLDNRLAASGEGLPGAPAPCALPEDELVAALNGTRWCRFYENWPASFWVQENADLHAAVIANALLEVAAGVPVVIHGDGGCPAENRTIARPGPLGGPVLFMVASYLLVADGGTTLSLSRDYFSASFCWRPELDVDFGAPLGTATRLSSHSWARNFTRANVFIDVSQGFQASVDLLA